MTEHMIVWLSEHGVDFNQQLMRAIFVEIESDPSLANVKRLIREFKDDLESLEDAIYKAEDDGTIESEESCR